MGPAASTASGVLVGLILFLAMAFTGVIAVNGVDNPGISRTPPSAAAGSTANPRADRADEGKAPSLRALDLNGDGKLSLAEAAGYGEIVTRFDRADRNKDGKLTQAEFERLAKLAPAKAQGKAKGKKPRRPETTAATGG
ncbi:MAG TPA: EF-hand domain-containing protein [Burkholderiales bacterium]|nr:EF-hand domain-containing protein [Burkholderiales bacterium]